MSVEDYSARITSSHRDKPKFVATVEASLAPIVAMQDAARAMLAAWDVDTAVGDQLDTIGKWVGIGRTVATPIAGVFFTWDEDADTGWDAGVWKGEFEIGDDLVTLTDDLYRIVIKAKIAANNWRGDIAGMRSIFTDAFGHEGALIIEDNGDMTVDVTYATGVFSAVEQALLTGDYIPVRPAGVAVTYTEDVLEEVELSHYHAGTIALAETLYMVVAVEPLRFVSASFLSITAASAFSSGYDMEIRKNGETIGLLIWDAGGTPPVSPSTVAMYESAFTLEAGDYLTVEGSQSLTDGTGGDISITITGQRLTLG